MDRLALNLYIKISLIFLASFFPSMETVVQRTLINNLSYGRDLPKKEKRNSTPRTLLFDTELHNMPIKVSVDITEFNYYNSRSLSDTSGL